MQGSVREVETGAASDVEHIIATATGEAGADVENRRLHGRFPLQGALTLFETDLGGNPTGELECGAEDISRSGIGLRSRRMLYPDRNVFVVVPTPTGKRVLYGLVRQCRYLEGQHCYHIGVSLLEMPATQTIKTWAASMQAG